MITVYGSWNTQCPHIQFCSPITNESPQARDGDGDGIKEKLRTMVMIAVTTSDGDGIKENDDNGDDCCGHSSVHCLSPYQAFCPRPQTAN